MRKGFLGSIAALAAGAATAWAQPPAEPQAPAGVPVVVQAQGTGPSGAPKFGGLPGPAVPGNAGFAPAPAIMPPGNFGPGYDPLGLGPVGGFGPPPGPMYPVPGPYAQQSWQSPPPAGGPGEDAWVAPRWWVNGEYLLWFTRGQEVRFPLVTSSAPLDGGVIGAASTAILSGNRALGYGAISGMRLGAGFFGDADRRIGFELTGFFTEHKPNVQDYGSLANTAGVPLLARPFIDISGAGFSAAILSGPNFGAATVRVRADHQTIGVSPVGVWNLYRAGPGSRWLWSLDLIAGYEFLQVREMLRVVSSTQFDLQTAAPVFNNGNFGIIGQAVNIGPALATIGGVVVGGPAVAQIRDEFRATNRFNGLVLGFKTDSRYGMFTSSLVAKCAVGNMHQRMEINGNSTFVDPTSNSGNPTAFGFGAGVGGSGGSVGGVLATPGNIGTYISDKFTFVPQVGATFGVALTRGLTGFVGVNFIYFPDMARPGSAVNPFVSSASIPFSPNFGFPGAPRSPAFRFVQEDLWVGGATMGLSLRY